MESFLFACALVIISVHPYSAILSNDTCIRSHFADFWKWPESSNEVSQSKNPSCSEAFAGNFPTSLEIRACNFTSGFNSVASNTPKQCSDECLVGIKMFLGEISDLDICYEAVFDALPDECENNLENPPNLEEIPECDFAATEDILEFQLPNSKSYVCSAECISDIKLLLGKFHWKKICYEDLHNVDLAVKSIESGIFGGEFKLRIEKQIYFESIIADVYQSYFVSLASFIEQLEKASYRQQFLENLYEKMKTEFHTENNNVIILKKLVDDEVDLSCNSTNSSMCTSLERLKTSVDLNAQNVLDGWASEVRTNAFAEIIEFGNPPTITPAGYAFNKVLPKLIDTTLDGYLANLKNTFAFVKELRWNLHKYEALSTLKTWLVDKEDRHKLLVAFGIKDAIENLNGPDPKEKVETDLELLKNSYSLIVRDVVWNGECRIRNAFYSDYNEYLHEGASQYQFEDGSKRVFTWTRPQIPDKSMWKFEMLEVDGEIRFSIRNVESGWNLCAYVDFKIPLCVFGICGEEETQIEADRRWVSMQNTIGKCDWYVEFDEEFRGIYLRNVGWNEYFYATKYKYPKNDQYRYPLLWKPGTIVDSSLWKLEFST